MAYIWDVKEVLQLINDNKEYAYLFDDNKFDELFKYMNDDGHQISKQFFNNILYNVLDLPKQNTDSNFAWEMKYTIVGTDQQNRYRYAGVNTKGIPCTLTMGETRTYLARVYFTDIHQAQSFFDRFIDHPKIKNRENQVNWKIIPISKRTPIGGDGSKGIEMEKVNSAVGTCFQIKK